MTKTLIMLPFILTSIMVGSGTARITISPG